MIYFNQMANIQSIENRPGAYRICPVSKQQCGFPEIPESLCPLPAFVGGEISTRTYVEKLGAAYRAVVPNLNSRNME